MRKGNLRDTLPKAGKNVNGIGFRTLFLFTGILLFSLPSIAQTTTFNFNGTTGLGGSGIGGSPQTYVVPAGVTQIGVDMIGAAGGWPCCSWTGSSGPQSLGGRVQCTLNVTPGTTLYVYVGGAGCNNLNTGTQSPGGWNGGGIGGAVGSSFCAGGGGASDIRTSTSGYSSANVLVVAGGGGGGGDFGPIGGPGGGTVGGTGMVFPCLCYTGGACGGGQAGPSCGTGSALGTQGQGGQSLLYSDGGGGGGWWGGNCGNTNGGGGGGSSYPASPNGTVTAIIHTQGYAGATGNGQVIITALASSYTPQAFNGGSPQSLVVCQSSGANQINSLLTTTGSTGYTDTWTISSGPTHGSLGGFSTTAASGTNISPSGTSYTPTPGYTGTDAFAIQVSDGTSTATTTVNVTVNPAPAAISGSSLVCIGSPVTFTNSVSGGTWSSSNTGTATVGSSTGLVSGVSNGPVTVSYTLANTCFVTKPITVDCAPTFTGGTPQSLNVCQNSVSNAINSLLTINDPDAGQTETWTVTSGPSHGTVTSGGTQVSTGGSVTPTGFSYTPNTSYSGPDAIAIQVSDGVGGTASLTINVTVNPIPAAIAGPTVVCIGGNITLTNTSGGGTWTSSATGIATIGTGSGVVTGIANGNATISYTLAGNCYSTYPIVVGALPAITSVTPSTVIPGNSVTIAGANFNTTVANNIVWFGAAAGTVTAASGTSLTVTVPNGATYGPLVVENNYCGLFGYAPYAFEPTYNNSAYVANTVNFATHVDNTTAAFPNHLSFGDIDGDGKVDIVTNNYNANSISIYLNTSTAGTVSFAAPVTISVPTAPGQPAVADIDGDGKPEIVVASAAPPGYLSVYRNTSTVGSISFAAPLSITFITNANGSTIRDIDGDGKPDIVSSNNSSMSVFRNTGSVGSLSFAARVDFASTAYINAVAAGDVDGDGKSDILAANNTTNLSVWRNTSTPGTISMASRQDFTTPGNPFFIVTADIDGDGKLDVLNTNTGSNNLSVFLNTSTSGTISLGTRTDFTTGNTPNNLTVGDLDGDGKPDVAVASTSGGNIGVFRNTSSSGSISLSSRTDFATGSGTAGAIAVDIDGDGKMDLAVTNQSANTMSVLRNNPLQPVSGALTACVGTTTTLSDATSGGTWSSGSTGIATVGSLTGVVTGVSAGTANITYAGTAGASFTGNIAVVTVTINANPGSITGTTNVCTGLTTALSDATSGGAWSSSNPTVATVGTSGIVSGAGAGIATITYSLPVSGCIVTAPVTVNQSPTAISGSFAVCVGANTTLTDGYSGGTWSSGSTGVATIGSASGVLSGVSAGNSTIVYTMPGNCTATQQVTVNTNPAAITGLSSICVGTFTTLSDATSGGLWSSSAPGIATVSPGSGLVIGAASGTSTLSYTLSATGCSATFPMTINANPAAITGTASVCVGLTTVLADATSGGTWSSTAGATVSGGTVTGVTAGNSTISYTLGTGCYSTRIVTVNANPVSISGTPTVCAGLTTLLSDATGTGSWSSSATGTASVGSGTGVVTGVTSGNATITYTLPTGCINTIPVTVNPLPATITGTFSACPGTSATLSSTSGGGTWTSNNTAVATIGSSSGTYTGVSAGVSTITYTLSTGCFATATITINPSPAAISGIASVCIGSTTTLSDATGGGTWTSSSGAATVGSSSGVVTGVSSGNPVITYSLGTGCIATVTATVNTLPASVGGATNVCVGSTATVTDGSGTSTWSSSNTALATVGSGTGVVTGVASGTLTITFTLPTGCFATAPFTVNPTPASIAGINNVCVGSTQALSDATSGGTWSSSNTGLATVSGSGVVSGGTAGTLNIVYTTSPGSCTATMPFTVNTTPAAITGTFNVCTGSTTSLADGTSGGAWTSSNTAQATVGTSGTVSGVAAGVPVITYTLPAGSCFATHAVTVNTTPASNTGAPTVCVGLTTTLANSTSGGTWSSLATGTATAASTTGVVTGVASGTASIVYTLGTGCTATTVVTVNPQPASISGTFTVCTGQTTSLTDGTSGGTWSSSNTSVATVGSTGVVSGVATGTAVISYTLTAGCFATATVTVNQTPSSIVGSSNLCIGVGTAMTDAYGGGTWTSQTTSLATIGSSSGTATGVATGTLNISYTLPGGCYVTLPVTVSTQPAAITGTANVCVGATTTLSDVTPSATWSSSNTAIATVGSLTGTVSGVSAGVVNITYTVTSGGCFSVQAVTVNPSPATIGGTAVVCANSTTTLTDATTGGTWSSSNTGLATVGSTGIVTGVSAGNPLISYTLPAGCATSVTLTVNALPSVFLVTGGGSYCSGGTGVHIGLSGSASGISYQLWRGTLPIGSPLTGSGPALDFGLITNAGSYTIIATNSTTGCSIIMTGSAVVSVNPLPFAYTVTGGGGYCSGGSGVHVFLANSAAGFTYQLFNGGTAVTGAIAGTGVSIDFGLQTTAGTYTVQGVNLTTSCSNTMAGSVTVTINPLPTAYTVTGGGGYCAGGTGQHVGLSTSDVGMSYQLYRGGVPTGSPLPGTAAALDFGLQTIGGVYTVVATNVATSCSNSMTGSVTVTVNPLPTVYAVTGGGGYCSGGTGVTVGLSSSTTGVNYLLYRGGTYTGTTIAGSGGSLSFGLQTITGAYTVLATNPTTTCQNNMSGSATVSINSLPTVYAVTGGGAYCSGGTGVHIGLSSSTTGISYQLYSGGSTVGGPIAGTGFAIDFGSITTAATYTAVATNSSTTCTVNMSGSAVVTINPLPLPFPVTGGGGYCVGGTGLAVGLSGTTSGISYQLYNGITPVGTPVVGGGGSISFGLQTAAGTYTVIGTNTITSCNLVMTGSATVSVNPLPTAYAVTGGGSYCSGGTGVVVGLLSSDIGVSYQLKLGGVNVPGALVVGTGFPITFGLQTGAGNYTVVATNSATTCVNNMTGSVTISVNPLPVVYSVTGGGSYCVGGSGVHVGLGNSNLGVNYQLYVGTSTVGSPVGGTNAPLDFGLMTAVGTYTVSATNATTGCFSNMSGSAVVSTNSLPAVLTVGGGGTLCAGGAGINVTVGPSTVLGVNYQLYNGASPVGASVPGNSGVVTFPAQTTAGTYTVVATNGFGCTSNMAGSAVITVNPLPNTYVVNGGGSYCTGGTGVHIGLTNSDPGVNYQLFNPAPVLPIVAGTGSALDFGLKTVAGTYTVVATNGTTGCVKNMTGSATVAINPLPGLFTVSGGGNYCAGSSSSLTVTLSGSALGMNYQLLVGSTPVGAPLPGTTGILTFGPLATPGVYTILATDATTGCTRTMTGSTTIGANPLPLPYAVTGGGSYCPGGSGDTVGVNGSNTGVNYRLYINGIPGATIAGTGGSLNFGLQTTLGTYTVVAQYASTGCTSIMTGSATVANYPLPALHMVTGGGAYCAGGSGVAVNLNGSDAGINYQLLHGGATLGIPIPGTGGPISFGLQTLSGTFTVKAANAITGCVDTMLDSVAVVANSLPLAQTVSGGGTYCVGGAGVDVAIGGSEAGMSYQLYLNGIPNGAPIPGTGLSLDFGFHSAPGVYTIVATNPVTLCTKMMTGSDTISLNPPPTAYTVTGGGSYCAGGTGVLVGLSNSQGGIMYSLFNGTTPVGGPVTGTGSAISFGLQLTPGIYTIRAVNPATGCNNNMLSSAVVAINALPTAYVVTGGGGYCIGTTGVPVGLSGSNTGISYQLFNGTGAVGAPVTGTGGPLTFGIFTANGTYTVQATNSATTCLNNMSGSTAVTTDSLPRVYTVTGSSSSYCAGGAGVHVFLSGSQPGVSYQLYRGTAAVGIAVGGTTTALDFGAQTIAGVYTVAASNVTTSCASNMTGSASVSINPLPATFSVIGGGSYCPGGTGVHVGLSGSVTGIKYQLYIGGGTPVGTAVSGTGFPIDFGLKTATGNYTVIANNLVTGCSSNMTGSATVGLNPVPLSFAVTGGGAYCTGGGGVPVGLSGTVAGTNYQLYFGPTPVGGPVAGTGAPISFGSQPFAGGYTVTATDALTSCTNNMAGSATIAVSTLPGVYSVTGGGNYCPGGAGVHVRLNMSDTGVRYQLYHGGVLSGAPLSGTGGGLDFGLFTGLGTYTVVATNHTTGCVSNMAGSAIIGLYSLPLVNNVVGGGSYCEGGAGVHVGLSGSSAGISYQLFKGPGLEGAPVLGTGTPVDFGLLTDSGTYTVIATNSATTCSTSMSGSATISVHPVVVPSLSISTGGSDSSCLGNSVMFTAVSSGTGSAPLYQWTVNGSLASTGTTYTYVPANHDVVGLTMLSNATCAVPSMVGSSVTMTVLPKLLPSVNITALPGTIVCRGTIVNFSANTTTAGSSPTFLWLKNGLHMSTSPVYADVPTDGDVITCQMTTSYYCPLAATVTSPAVTMEVDTPVTPKVAILVSPGLNIYPGESLILTAHLSNTVPYPSYKWYRNSIQNPAYTTPTYSSNTLNDLDVITCEVTSGGGCAGQTNSASVTVHVMNVGVKPVTAQGMNVKLLPNPNKGVFTIKGSLGTLSDDEVSVEITDMLGQVVFRNKVMAPGGEIDQRIQLNSVANGMYLVNIRTADQNTVLHVVVEQ